MFNSYGSDINPSVGYCVNQKELFDVFNIGITTHVYIFWKQYDTLTIYNGVVVVGIDSPANMDNTPYLLNRFFQSKM